MTPDTPGGEGSASGHHLPPDVAEVLRLAEEVGAYGVRRRLGTLLHTPLTVQQLRCLTLLVVQGTATPQQLSDALEVTPATLTGIADRLVRAGMVTRGPDERDGRGRRLAPTPAAQEVVRQLMASDIEADAAVLSALTEEELAGIRLGLSGVLRVLRAADPGGTAAP